MGEKGDTQSHHKETDFTSQRDFADAFPKVFLGT